MELEFDKEIDLLLRKGPRDQPFGERPVDAPIYHLDADELAAFAENAMPEKTRTLYVRHLADCDSCRKKLSGLILLNAEAGSPEARIAAPAGASAPEPWYRRLFLFPNLAYVMGGLVLIFGGLITLTLFQDRSSESSTVSQIVESDTAKGPMASEQLAQIESSDSNASFANAIAASNKPASNAAANTAAAAPSGSASGSNANAGRVEPRTNELRSETSPADDLEKVQPAAGVPAPPPPAADQTVAAESEAAKAVKEDRKVLARKRTGAVKDDRDDVALSAKQAQEAPRTQAGGVAKATPGPSRNAQQTFPNRADNTYELGSRRIGGKDFQLKNGVWYDVTYKGQPTTNVRRQTDEYRNLDGGIRTIAEGLRGVVVVVWKDKAYRIQ